MLSLHLIFNMLHSEDADIFNAPRAVRKISRARRERVSRVARLPDKRRVRTDQHRHRRFAWSTCRRLVSGEWRLADCDFAQLRQSEMRNGRTYGRGNQGRQQPRHRKEAAVSLRDRSSQWGTQRCSSSRDTQTTNVRGKRAQSGPGIRSERSANFANIPRTSAGSRVGLGVK